MTNQALTHRFARREDLEALRGLMALAISENQKPFLDENQIASSRAIMGLDTQLIDDFLCRSVRQAQNNISL